MQNRGGQKVIERILVAYGFTSRQAFCNHLGISQSTMANRYARDTFPADWVIICSIETGASIDWLASGISCESSSVLLNDERLAHTKSDDLDRTNSIVQKFPIETSINPNKGGKAAIDRLVEAYGFSTRQALANHLQVSKALLQTGTYETRFLAIGSFNALLKQELHYSGSQTAMALNLSIIPAL